MKRDYLRNLIFMSSFFISGCAGLGPQPGAYYFGNYSKSLYEFKKAPNPASLAKHQQNLSTIIQKTEEAKAVVPPSLYSELGFTFYQQNNFSAAIRYFKLETHHYPESTVVMDHMIKLAQPGKKTP